MRPQLQDAIELLASHAKYRRRFVLLFKGVGIAAVYYSNEPTRETADALKAAALLLFVFSDEYTPREGIAVPLNRREKLLARAALEYGETRDGGRLGVAAMRFSMEVENEA